MHRLYSLCTRWWECLRPRHGAFHRVSAGLDDFLVESRRARAVTVEKLSVDSFRVRAERAETDLRPPAPVANSKPLEVDLVVRVVHDLLSQRWTVDARI